MIAASEGFIARLGGRSVILDVARDKYLLLGERLTEIALNRVGANIAEGIAGGQQFSMDAKGLQRENFERGLPAELKLAQGVPIANDTLWPTNDGGLGLGWATCHSARVLKCLHDVQSNLQRKSFQETIEYMRGAKERSLDQRPTCGVQLLLDTFHSARPWFWVPPICRLDALALALLLWRCGTDVNLVFGVRLEPFRAHCWAQVGRIALNEPHQRLLQYTHIMII